MFGPQGESGSEPEDDSQMKFYTEHRGRRRSKGERECRSASLYIVINVLHSKDITLCKGGGGGLLPHEYCKERKKEENKRGGGN